MATAQPEKETTNSNAAARPAVQQTAAAPATTRRKSSSASNASTSANGWQICYYCPRETFKSVPEFTSHLRSRHCTREGGSFVCRYGFNGVCPSLPLDGVSDRDYEAHVTKYHVNQQFREKTPGWSIYLAAQNLPSVLNDPTRGKQSNLFTKKWGEHFVEPAKVPPTPRLPEIKREHFESYLAKIGKRYRRHERITAEPSEPILAESASPVHETPLSVVPEIFFKDHLQLNHPGTFAQVFVGNLFPNATTATEECQQSSHQLQDKLSHYLDIVEDKITYQVSQKSSAFFLAMTTQHAIVSEMQEAAQKVKELRESLKKLQNSVVLDSFRILRCARRRQLRESTLDKLKLMATVHKTQPMLQMLLGTEDYVAALDLIDTTHEILSAELTGVHCFRHLPSQLHEMEKLIDKMLTTDFERYVATDLNRPLAEVLRETDSVYAEDDKLVCIVMGLLRMKNFGFVNTYKDAVINMIRARIKALVIVVIAGSDAEVCLTGTGEEPQDLSIGEWITLLRRATAELLTVLQRIKTVATIMQQTADAAAGPAKGNNSATAVNLIDAEAFLNAENHAYVTEQLQSLLLDTCNYCHERCANVVSAESLERRVASAAELEQLSAIVHEFSEGCQAICGTSSAPLQLAVKAQASRYAQKFHAERKDKLAMLLDSECWRQVDIPNEFQRIIGRIEQSDFSQERMTEHSDGTELVLANGQAGPVLLVEGKPYALVSAALMLVRMLYDYCTDASRQPNVAVYHSRNIVDLLRKFNSRSCQLIIGAGAVSVAGLKTITSTNLALTSRALQLVLWLLPRLRAHFESLELSVSYDAIERDYKGHIKEIETKILSIIASSINTSLADWNARPPVPSPSLRNITRNFVKLHEAIASVLPEAQLQAIYAAAHQSFKSKLRERLRVLNIYNNGGPQHGLVTSELTFYVQTLRTLRALPANQLDDRILEEIWQF